MVLGHFSKSFVGINYFIHHNLKDLTSHKNLDPFYYVITNLIYNCSFIFTR
jgi:hypothetical protein